MPIYKISILLAPMASTMKRRAERSIVPLVRRKITSDVAPPHLALFQRSHEVKELLESIDANLAVLIRAANRGAVEDRP
jgi:hypothetical protein